MDWKIIYYTEGERQPVKEFIDAQFPKAKAKILRNLLLLSEFGPDIGYPLISNIERNLWEHVPYIRGISIEFYLQ